MCVYVCVFAEVEAHNFFSEFLRQCLVFLWVSILLLPSLKILDSIFLCFGGGLWPSLFSCHINGMLHEREENVYFLVAH